MNEKYMNRELSWIGFNYRILSEARDKANPLFERLKFLSITSSNLDEFFMVRVASLKDMINADCDKKDIAGMTPKEQDEKICLCHGMSGNLLIMKKYLRKYGNKKMKEQYEALCDCLLFQLDHPAKISGTEYLNLAFMNGISGTGMALMEIL